MRTYLRENVHHFINIVFESKKKKNSQVNFAQNLKTR